MFAGSNISMEDGRPARQSREAAKAKTHGEPWRR